MSTCVHVSIIHNSPQVEMPCSTSRKWDRPSEEHLYTQWNTSPSERGKKFGHICNVDEP